MSNHLLLSPAVAKALFWAAACLCGIAHLAILRSVLRFPARRTMEIAWAIIPAALLAVVLVLTWRNIAVSV